MSAHHHPDDATILAFAAGALNEGFSLVLAGHLEYCPRCRSYLSEAEALGGELMTELPPVEMSADSLNSVWELINAAPPELLPKPSKPSVNHELPAVLAPYLEGGLESIRWRSLVPGIRQFVFDGIDSGKGSVRLLSIAPGMSIPHHSHRGGEMALILRGSYVDEIGRFKRGDLADLDESVDHQPVVDREGPCICLMATDERLRFSGLVSRMLQPLIGI